MGCTNSVYAMGKKKKKMVPEIAIFSGVLRVPVQLDLQRVLRGCVPNDVADRIASTRKQIVLLAEDTTGGGSASGNAITELTTALQGYLPLLIGLTNKEYGVEELVEFRWRDIGEEKDEQKVYGGNSWFEILCVLHMMAMLTLMEANEKLIPKESSHSERLLSADCMRDAVDLLLKAAGYLNFCLLDVLPRLSPELKSKLPPDMQGDVLEAITQQALAQGTEVQLGLAVKSQNATLSVKRRLACEEHSFYAKAYLWLSNMKESSKSTSTCIALKKQLYFLKWKLLEAKGAAYHYHGLIVDKGREGSSHVTALCCSLAAEDLLIESKKASLTFCLAQPTTRCPPSWGAMKHLNKKIPETASNKSHMYAHLLVLDQDQDKDKDKALKLLPPLPEFQLSLKPDDYQLPKLHPLWEYSAMPHPDPQQKRTTANLAHQPI